MATTARAIGDSITAGSGASDSDHRWSTLVCAAHGYTETNNASPATQIIDQVSVTSGQVFRYVVAADSLSLWLSGYNDLRYFGTDADGLETYTRTLRAALAWLCRLPDDIKQVGDAEWTYVGTWTTAPLAFDIDTKYTATHGDHASVIVTGTAVTIAYRARFADGGMMSVTIDGVLKDTIDTSFGSPSGYGGGTTTNVAMARRYGGLSSGSHTVLLTLTSADGTYAHVYFVTGNGETTHVPAYIGAPPKMAIYNSNAPYDQGSDAAVAAYTSAIQAACAECVADGAGRVKCVPVNDYYVTASDISDDQVHPKDTGHQHIADAFAASIASPDDVPPVTALYSNGFASVVR